MKLSDQKRLPVVQQSEIAECGLACLVMVARYHGHDIDLANMRRRFPISLKGAGLSRLISIAGTLGFETRPLRAEVEHLREITPPCILHWDLNHFVVLKQIDRERAVVHDPARGEVSMSLAEFGRHYTGVALELTPASGFEPVRERQRISVSSLVGRVTGVRRALAQVLLLAFSLEVLTLALPLSMQWVVDDVLVSADLGLLTLIGISFLAIVVLQSATAAMRGWVVAGIGASLNSQWLSNLFGHLLRLPLDYFEKRSVGGVLSRFMSLQTIQQTLTGSFVEAVLDGLTVSLVLILLLLYSPLLTGLVLGAFAIYALLRWLAYRKLWSLKEEQLTFVARQQTQLIESIHGVQTIKLANQQAQRRARVANATVEVANREAAIGRVAALFGGLSRLVFGTQRVLLIWIAAWMTLRGQFSAGMLVVFVAYADLFATRTSSLIDKFVDLRLLGLHGQRIADVALEPPEPHVTGQYSGPVPVPTLVVDGVSFRYAEDEPWILRDCSLRIEAGESVAIVGPSGCGKTTLAKLLLGLLHPAHGKIEIGGVDIRHYGLGNYRARFGTVMQDDALFAGSIAENISGFDSDATPETIEAAARAAQIHDDILRMPMGYESLVGDMGSTLSGGQKQRVLLARALYREPSILLLDEATSHLDVARERAINDCIAELAMTRIVIAHRPETILSTDRVIELRDGAAIVRSASEYAGVSIRERARHHD